MSSNQLRLSTSELKINIKACTLCDGDLPFAAKPIFSFSVTSKILIVGQAPGIKMHESGITWNGGSGDRLREPLGVTKKTILQYEKFFNCADGVLLSGKR